jgi:GntR family transcriptional regulator
LGNKYVKDCLIHWDDWYRWEFLVTTPMYRRIAQELRQQIRSGNPRPGEQLPTELELSERYEASRNTVRDAIKWLAVNGLVETRPGQGTFVRPRIAPFVTTLSVAPETGLGGGEGEAAFSEVKERGREPSASVPRVAVELAVGNIAARLRIPEGTQVVSRHQERFIDGTLWSLQTTYYPMDLVAQGAGRLISAEPVPGGAVAYLGQALGLTQVGYRDRILVRSPDEDESRFFGLPDDGSIPVLVIMRTGYRASDKDPVPYRVTFTVLPADRNQLVINSGDVPGDLAAPAND